jgi:hypothetical protein
MIAIFEKKVRSERNVNRAATKAQQANLDVRSLADADAAVNEKFPR